VAQDSAIALSELTKQALRSPVHDYQIRLSGIEPASQGGRKRHGEKQKIKFKKYSNWYEFERTHIRASSIFRLTIALYFLTFLRSSSLIKLGKLTVKSENEVM